MTGEIEQAAYNNALWCDVVCSTHSGPGEFRQSHWLNRHGAPRYYPDLVTLTGSRDANAQTEAISELVASSSRKSRSVKDSFRCLDLHALGFELLFDAEWLRAVSPRSNGPQASEDVQWVKVTTETDLIRWEEAWARGDAEAGNWRMFRPSLLSRPEIQIISAFVDIVPAGGGILNAGAGVVGLSNIFAHDVDLELIWCGLANVAQAAFPSLPLVTYDRGENLTAGHNAGFATIGHLRIWALTDAVPLG